MDTVFITGTAGFIGFHLARLLLDTGWKGNRPRWHDGLL